MRDWVQPCLPGLDYDEYPPIYADLDDLDLEPYSYAYDEDEGQRR